MSIKRKVVYTAIFGDYDVLLEPDHMDSGIDYICFTNNPNIRSKKWKVNIISNDKGIKDNAMLNRFYKFMPHIFLSEYDESLYIDGNIKICGKDLTKAFSVALREYNISIPSHAERDCIYEEANVCLELGKGNPEMIKMQMQFYQEQGYPRHYGLYENNIIFRRHNSSEIKKIMEDWFLFINQFSARDQLSLCYLFWKNNIKCESFIWGPKFSHKFFEIKFHQVERALPIHKRIVLHILLNAKANMIYGILEKIIKRLK